MTKSTKQVALNCALTYGLPLLALWHFAFAQPLFDMLVNNNTYLVAHGLSGWALLLFTVAVSFLLPVLALGLWCLLSPIHDRLRPVPALVSWGLTCVIFMQFFRKALEALSPGLELIVAAGSSGLLVWFLKDKKLTTSFLRLTAVSALILPVLFLVQLPKNFLLQADVAADRKLGTANHTNPLPDIVLVIFDELALTTLLNDEFELDSKRYPNFASFAAMSTWYPQASSAAASTRVAIPALLSGTTPNRELSSDAASYPNSLFSFASSNYEFHVEEPITKLCSPEICRQSLSWRLIAIDTVVLFGYVSRLRLITARLPPVGATWGGFLEDWSLTGADARVASLERFIDGLATDGQPHLHFLHLVLPHLPYTILPSGARLFRHGPLSGHAIDEQGDRFLDEPWAITEARELYEWQLRFVDGALGRTIETLRTTGRYDDALVIVTADHGVRFTSGETRREPSETSYLDIASVPLMIKYPGQTEGRRSDWPIQSTDLFGLIKHVVTEGSQPTAPPQAARRILATDGWVDLPAAFDFAVRENPSRASLDAGLLANLHALPSAGVSAACAPALPMQLAEPQLYRSTHPAHFLPAHVVFQIDAGAARDAVDERQLLLAFNGQAFAVRKTGAGRYSGFVDPALFKSGFNQVKLLEYRPDGPCVVYDNRTEND